VIETGAVQGEVRRPFFLKCKCAIQTGTSASKACGTFLA
jgi:hypothetical protein